MLTMSTMVNVNPGLYNQPLGFEYLGQNSLFFATSLFRQRFINPERTLVENQRNQRSTYWYSTWVQNVEILRTTKRAKGSENTIK